MSLAEMEMVRLESAAERIAGGVKLVTQDDADAFCAWIDGCQLSSMQDVDYAELSLHLRDGLNNFLEVSLREIRDGDK